jgi:hypothetical protein
MVLALISFIVGGIAGFVAGIKNANSSKVDAVTKAVTSFKK